MNLSTLFAGLAYQLKNQDNLGTMHPAFCVQECKRLVGLDSAYSDRRCWHDSANEHTVYDDDPDFDKVKWALEKSDDYEEFGYIDQWFTVTMCFTKAGAEEYIRCNGHNLQKPRIYVESFYRNEEMIAIRQELMK